VTATYIDPQAGDLLSVAVSGSAPLVRLTAVGEIDSSSAPLIRTHLDELLDDIDAHPDGGATEVTVDLDRVTFLDSAGLCVLAAAHRRAAALGVRLRVLASSRAVIRPLQITGLWDLLGVEQVEPGAGSVA
jgi:anti-sigma B factor antagonist